MTGAVLNSDNLLKDRPEILAACAGECPRDVFPNEESRSNKVIWCASLFMGASHLLCDSNLFHKKAGAFSCKAGALPGNR